MAKLIFGCGYLGERVARKWRDAGHEVWAITRRPSRARELAELGIRPLVRNLSDPIRLPDEDHVETVLFAVGYDRSAGQTVHEVFVQGLQNALSALPASVRCFLYISSTGVYGQNAGEWVDEDSPCGPRRAGGRACLAAEQLLQSHPFAARVVILRMAGLYGPGRIPKLEAVRAGAALPAARSGFLNLIHVDDAAEVVLAAEAKARPPCCYVVSDGCPVSRHDFYREVGRLLSAPPLRFEEPHSDSSAGQRAASSKRVRATRMKRDLQVSLRFPSYREGLQAIVAGH
jgi:nucleoside-diphosphate-sugar epimerase